MICVSCKSSYALQFSFQKCKHPLDRVTGSVVCPSATALAVWTDGIHATTVAHVLFRILAVDGFPTQLPTVEDAMQSFTVNGVIATGQRLPSRVRPLLRCVRITNLVVSHHWHRQANDRLAAFDRTAANPVRVF